MDLFFIYFVYGLAFFLMGFAVLLEALHTSVDIPFARAMWPLASFGIIHGIHEWLEMFVLYYVETEAMPIPIWAKGLRVLLLGLSFASLMAFSLKLMSHRQMSFKADFMLGVFISCLWGISVLILGLLDSNGGQTRDESIRSWLLLSDAWSRYSLAIPGSIIGSYALWKQARQIQPKRRVYAFLILLGALTLLLYGLVGQIFVPKTNLLFAQTINAERFNEWTGIPIQVIRAMFGGMLAFAVIPVLNMFELEREQALAAARQQIQTELEQREQMRRDMLKHLVKMQEEERSRIGREIHDEIGQTLTAITIGLQQAKQQMQDSNQLETLRQLTVNAVSELDHLVTGLRPRHIDHLGLIPALRLLVKQYRERFALEIGFDVTGSIRQLSNDGNLAIFRIIQESLTNVVRHAQTQHVEIKLSFEPRFLSVAIEDHGVGFDSAHNTRSRWGLLGMEDRAEQLGGELLIQSQKAKGTAILLKIPYDSREEENHARTD